MRNLIYGVYPRSFIGEDGSSAFKKIGEASNLFLPLGVDYVWLNPVFLDGGADGGYDIIDFKKVNPALGTEQELLALANGPLKDKVLLDIVFNHVSTKSPFFEHDKVAAASEGELCIWRKEPTNWVSLFGGSPWEYVPGKGEYYLHLFTKEQADINFTNPWWIAYFHKVVRYWWRQGIAGFRIDTCNILSKTLEDSTFDLPGFDKYHQLPDNIAILNRIFDGTSVFTVGETVLASPREMQDLTTTGPLTTCFNAAINDAADGMFLSPADTHEVNLEAWVKKLMEYGPNSGLCLQLESHDFPRSTSRFGADERALAIFQFTWPVNNICLWMGQELGLNNRNDLREQDTIDAYQSDPHAKGIYDELTARGLSESEILDHLDKISRLHARNDYRQIFNVDYAEQIRDPASSFNLYKKLIRLWKTDPVLLHGDFSIKYLGTHIIGYNRTLGEERWEVHLDFSTPDRSFATKYNGERTVDMVV